MILYQRVDGVLCLRVDVLLSQRVDVVLFDQAKVKSTASPRPKTGV